MATFDSATRAGRYALAMVDSARELGLAIRVGRPHRRDRWSGATRDLLEGSGLGLEHRGAHELKGLPGPRDVYLLTPGPR